MATLNEKQIAFCREYIIDFNATQAAIRAGYSERTAKAQGSRLLTNVDVSAKIRELTDQRAKRTEITADRVIQEFAKIAFSDFKDVAEWTANHVNLKPMDQVDGTVISEIKNGEFGITVKLHDKMRALEALAKHTGVYDERPQVNVDVQAYIDAIKGAAAGDLWDGFKNETPDGDTNGQD